MASVDIDLIYGPDALKQVDEMNAKLAEGVEMINKMASASIAMNKSLSGNSGDSGIKQRIKDTDELTKKEEKLAFVLSDKGKAVAEYNEKIRQANADNKLLAQYNLALNDTYEKKDALLKQLNIQYKRNVDLGKEETESTKKLKEQINQLTEILKKSDQQRGITNRLVGDYKNQLQGLEVQIRKNIEAYNAMSTAEKNSTAGFTVRQDIMQGASQYHTLTNVVNTSAGGFLKFENVIKKQPDALDKVIAKIDATNKGFVSSETVVVKSSKGIAGAIGNIWSVIRQAANILPGLGISGIFLAFGTAVVWAYDKIKELNGILKESSVAFDTMNEAMAGSEYKQAIKDVSNLTENIKLAKEGFISKDETLKLYNDTLGKTIGHAKSLNEAEDLLVKHGDAYIQMTLLKSAANLALEKSAQLALDAEIERRKGEKEILDKIDSEGNYKESAKQSFLNLFTKGIVDDEKQAEKSLNEAYEKTKKKGDEFKQIAEDFAKQAAQISKTNKFDFYGGKEDPKKSSTQTPTNRIEILKKQYEDEILAQKKLFVDGTLSEQEFRYKQLEIIQDYATKRVTAIKNLSNAEKDTLRSLDNEWLNTTKDIADKNTADQRKRLEELDKQVEGFATAEDKELKALADRYKEEARLREENAKDADFWFNWLEDQSDKQFAAEQKRIQKKQQLNDAYWNGWVSTGRSANDIIDTIANAIYQRELTRLDNKDKALTKSYNDEIRFIEQSGYSQAEQAKMKAKLDAETEARRKQIDRDKITALRKQAQFNKLLTISELTLETTIAVMRALADKSVPNPYLRALNAVSAGVAGGAQIARAAAVQLPQYAKGRGKTGRAEFALVGEENGGAHEAILRGDGTLEVTPAKPTVTYLGPQDQVFSNKDFMQSIMNAAYIKLANSGQQATTSALDAAVLDRLDSILLENQLLRQELIKKNFGSPQTDMSGFRNYKAQYIKQ